MSATSKTASTPAGVQAQRKDTNLGSDCPSVHIYSGCYALKACIRELKYKGTSMWRGWQRQRVGRQHLDRKGLSDTKSLYSSRIRRRSKPALDEPRVDDAFVNFVSEKLSENGSQADEELGECGALAGELFDVLLGSTLFVDCQRSSIKSLEHVQ